MDNQSSAVSGLYSLGQSLQNGGAPAQQMSLTETLNEAANAGDQILAGLNEAHHRLFGHYPLPPTPTVATKETQPNAASLASTVLARLRDIQQAMAAHHSRI